MEKDPIRNDARASRRARRLGKDAACVLCGERDRTALLKVDRSLLDEHHLAGRVNDERLTANVCRNCHSVLTEGQLRHGVDLADDAAKTMPESLVSALLGLGAFRSEEGRRLLAWAHCLEALIRALDEQYPGWRELPEAKKR